MPTLEENAQSWNVHYPWPQQGEEWSKAWGGSQAQWFGAILPRIQRFLPAKTICEIGPGFGRWTHYLKDHCDRLVGIDLAEKCVAACKKRFDGDPRLSFHVNDGRSLAAIPDGSIDFVFSFDTLVHAESDVVEVYLKELRQKLVPGGSGFIHHSNLGNFARGFSLAASVDESLRNVLFARDFLGPTHWRASSMSAEIFRQHCERAGLQCVSQELINWGTESLTIDCFSVFTLCPDVRETLVTQNAEFMKEAELIRRRSMIYGERPRTVTE